MNRGRAIALGALTVGMLDLLDAVVFFGIRNATPPMRIGQSIAASRWMPLLVPRPLICGAIYGVGVYFFMNLVVIPLSAIGPQPFVAAPLVNGLAIHIAGVGIPSALFAAASSRAPQP